VGTLPVLFVPTTVNANPGEQVVCSGIVVTAGVFTTNCNGNLQGDPIANANATLIFTQFNGARGTPVVLLINPGVFIPAAGAVAPVGVPFANAIPQVAIPAVPRPPVQFIPSPPPPLLPPLGGIPPLQAPGAAMAPPSYPEVPVIPEADTVLLLVGGLAALGAVAALRGRGSRRRDD